MENKLELQQQYKELKDKFDELNELYWSLEESESFRRDHYVVQQDYKQDLEEQIRDTWYSIKALNKKLYYER